MKNTKFRIEVREREGDGMEKAYGVFQATFVLMVLLFTTYTFVINFISIQYTIITKELKN